MTVHTSLEIRQSDLVPKKPPNTVRQRLWPVQKKPVVMPPPRPPKPSRRRVKKPKRRDVDFNQHVLDTIFSRISEDVRRDAHGPRAKPMHDVAAEVVNQFPGTSMADVLGDRRTSRISLVRHLAMYAVYAEHRSLPRVGVFFGREHTSVLFAVQKLELIYGKIRRGSRTWPA